MEDTQLVCLTWAWSVLERSTDLNSATLSSPVQTTPKSDRPVAYLPSHPYASRPHDRSICGDRVGRVVVRERGEVGGQRRRGTEQGHSSTDHAQVRQTSCVSSISPLRVKDRVELTPPKAGLLGRERLLRVPHDRSICGDRVGRVVVRERGEVGGLYRSQLRHALLSSTDHAQVRQTSCVSSISPLRVMRVPHDRSICGDRVGRVVVRERGEVGGQRRRGTVEPARAARGREGSPQTPQGRRTRSCSPDWRQG
jgi:hypothetical protein